MKDNVPELPLNLFDVSVQVRDRRVLTVNRDGHVLSTISLNGPDDGGIDPVEMMAFLIESEGDGLRIRPEWRDAVQECLAEDRAMERDHVGEFGRWSIVLIPFGTEQTVSIIVEDLSELDIAAERLRVAETIFRKSPSGILVMDAIPTILYANEAVTAITGYAPGELIGKNPRILRSPRHERPFLEQVWRQIMDNGYWEGETWAKRKGGMEFPQWLIVMAVRNPEGEPYRLVATFRDITRNKQQEEFMQYLARQDVLTGLPHRNHFSRLINDSLKHARQTEDQVAVGMLDLDEFNLINRTHGHRFGDLLLRKVSERLVEMEDERIAFGRLGGDEFGLLIRYVEGEADLEHVCERVLAQFDKPFLTERGSLYLTVGLGMASFPDNGKRADILQKHAEAAMRASKRAGRNRWRLYVKKMDEESEIHLQLKSDLHRAVKQNEFILHYQPRIDVQNSRIEGAECLIRWKHPQSGKVMPDYFIPLAEESDLILPIGRWVLEKAIQQLVSWRTSGFNVATLSVNVSPRQLYRGDLLGLVGELIRKHQAPPGCLELELTESAVLDDLDHAVNVLSDLRQLGVRIAMDDFGTGYSSLNYLRLLPLDTLKIERSFVRDLMTESDSRAVIRTLFQLARDLNLRTVAEGVESVEQYRFLRDAGCDEVQGFLLSASLPAPEFYRFVQQFDIGQLKEYNGKTGAGEK